MAQHAHGLPPVTEMTCLERCRVCRWAEYISNIDPIPSRYFLHLCCGQKYWPFDLFFLESCEDRTRVRDILRPTAGPLELSMGNSIELTELTDEARESAIIRNYATATLDASNEKREKETNKMMMIRHEFECLCKQKYSLIKFHVIFGFRSKFRRYILSIPGSRIFLAHSLIPRFRWFCMEKFCISISP